MKCDELDFLCHLSRCCFVNVLPLPTPLHHNAPMQARSNNQSHPRYSNICNMDGRCTLVCQSFVPPA